MSGLAWLTPDVAFGLSILIVGGIAAITKRGIFGGDR